MSFIKNYLYKQMEDHHNASLRRYEAEQTRLYHEAKEREENPRFYWHVQTQKWEEYVDTEKEAFDLINQAKKEGVEYEWARYTDIEYPAWFNIFSYIGEEVGVPDGLCLRTWKLYKTTCIVEKQGRFKCPDRYPDYTYKKHLQNGWHQIA